MKIACQLILTGAVATIFAGLGSCSRSHHETTQQLPSTGERPPSTYSPDHVYTTQEMASLFERPITGAGLLRNLKVAWDKKLLVQPGFFDDTNLMRFFNGTAVVWDKPTPGMEADWTIRTGTLTIDSKVFPNVTVGLRQSHHVVKEQRAPTFNVVIPAYTQDIGSIAMHVESVSGFTWGAVKQSFGPGAKDTGVFGIWEGPGPEPRDGPWAEALAGKANMRYLYPGDDPSKVGPTDLSQATFALKQGPQARDASGFVIRTPQDSDFVQSISIYQSVK
jgi:hypothetical protein